MEIVIYFIESTMVVLFVNCLLKSKFNKSIEYIILAESIVIFTILTSIINQYDNFETHLNIIYFIAIIGYSQLFFEGKELNKLLYAVLAMCILIQSKIIASVAVPILFELEINEALNVSSNIRVITLCMAKALQFVISAVAVFLFKKNHFGLKKSEWVWFSTILLLSTICGSFVFNMAIPLKDSLSGELLMSIIFLLGLINVIIFALYLRFAKNSTRLAEYEKHVGKINYEISTAIKLQEANLKLSTLRHDLQGQLNIIREIVSKNDLATTRDYLDKIENRVGLALAENRVITTNVSSINAILNSYIAKFLEREIEFDFDVADFDIGKIDEFDISSIIVNLLENAMTACVNLKDSKIVFKLSNKRRYLLVECKNNFLGEVNLENGDYKTTKYDSEQHGFGLRSIKSIVEKYDGMSSIESVNNEFRVKIFLGV